MPDEIPDLFHLLEERGFIHQCTDSDGLRAALAAGPLTLAHASNRRLVMIYCASVARVAH